MMLSAKGPKCILGVPEVSSKIYRRFCSPTWFVIYKAPSCSSFKDTPQAVRAVGLQHVVSLPGLQSLFQTLNQAQVFAHHPWLYTPLTALVIMAPPAKYVDTPSVRNEYVLLSSIIMNGWLCTPATSFLPSSCPTVAPLLHGSRVNWPRSLPTNFPFKIKHSKS
jgi:hypothetical protein